MAQSCKYRPDRRTFPKAAPDVSAHLERAERLLAETDLLLASFRMLP
jgi:hypothetical protein